MSSASPESLTEVARATPQAQWIQTASLREYGTPFHLVLPLGNSITSSFMLFTQGLGIVRAGTLRVAPELRRNGIGTRLTRSLGALAGKYRCARIETEIRSQYSFDIANTVFGEERLSFYERAGESLRPVAYDGIRDELVRVEADETDLENRKFGFVVHINLRDLDMAGWEVPEESALRLEHAG